MTERVWSQLCRQSLQAAPSPPSPPRAFTAPLGSPAQQQALGLGSPCYGTGAPALLLGNLRTSKTQCRASAPGGSGWGEVGTWALAPGVAPLGPRHR